MAIKLFPVGAFEISPNETPASIINSLQTCWGFNFTGHLQEMQTGRQLPADEKIIDGREYYMNFDETPNFPAYEIPPTHP